LINIRLLVVNRPLLKIFQMIGIITKWRVDWQRSLRLGRSIVAGLGVDIEDHPLFAIENSQIDSQFMKDRLKKFNEYATFLVVDGITAHVIMNYK